MNPLSERLRDVCAAHGRRVAVLDRGRAFTYAALDARVRAACLDAASFRPRPLPEDLVFGGISDTKTEKKPASR